MTRQGRGIVITTALIAAVSIGLVAAVRGNKWWWDNLVGPDSSNFVAPIKSKSPMSASSRSHGSTHTPRRASIRSSSTT